MATDWQGPAGARKNKLCVHFCSLWAFDDQGSEHESHNGSALRLDTCRAWTEYEKANRSRLPLIWKDILNRNRHRPPILHYLAENKLPANSEKLETILGRCCGRCHPGRTPKMMASISAKKIRYSSKNTRAGLHFKRLLNGVKIMLRPKM